MRMRRTVLCVRQEIDQIVERLTKLGRWKLTHRRLEVVLSADRLDERELRLEEVDVLLGVRQDTQRDVAADEVALASKSGSCRRCRCARHLEREIALERLDTILTDVQLAEILKVGSPSRKRTRSTIQSACRISPSDSL